MPDQPPNNPQDPDPDTVLFVTAAGEPVTQAMLDDAVALAMSQTTECDAADQILRTLMATIDRHGWTIVGGHDERGPFFYTVGLTFLRLPELIAEDVDMQTAHRVLDALAAAAAAGVPLESDALTSIGGHMVTTAAREDLSRLVWARVLFGDHDPQPPTALTVTITGTAETSR